MEELWRNYGIFMEVSWRNTRLEYGETMEHLWRITNVKHLWRIDTLENRRLENTETR